MPTLPPWDGNAWYIFEHAPATCHETVVSEQQLLCVADKLKSIADAVAPISWEKTATATSRPSGVPAGPWTIPIQSEKDKFIARDLAIHTLAQLVRLSSRDPNFGEYSCARRYASNFESGFSSSDAVFYFGAEEDGINLDLPPAVAVNSANFTALNAARMEVELTVLRAGGRMLHDLIRESVYADLAGSAVRAGGAVDRLKGNRIAWGVEDAANGPYNSYAHAIRILKGRWEIGPVTMPWTGMDPQCAGVAPVDVLSAGYGRDFSARTDDVPITSKGQSAAVRLLETTGIVLPRESLSASGSVLRGMVRDQLLIEAAKPHGISITATNLVELLGDQGKAIESAVNEVTDADFHFAFERALRTYRLLTNEGEDTTSMNEATTSNSVAGLFAKPDVAPSVTSNAGNAFQKGLGRNRIHRDAIARAAGISAATQCNPLAVSGFEKDSALRAETLTDPYYWNNSDERDQFNRTAFQDVFGVANAFKKRLGVITHAAAPYEDGGALKDIKIGAKAGVAELRTWVGPGRVYTQFIEDSSTSMRIEGIHVFFEDARAEEVGFATTAEAQAQVSLVFGAPWVAECAAKLRDSCPASIFQLRPTSVTKLESSENDSYGVTNDSYDLYFEMPSSGLPSGAGEFFWDQPTGAYHVILESDPKAPRTHGLVVGSTVPRAQGELSGGVSMQSAPFAPMHTELINAILGFDDSKDEYPAAIGESSAATGPSYCVDGLRRDLFVPLENELTSDSDPFENSWRHYLTVAKLAAVRADELGNQLITAGLTKDLRRESAAEALGEICGDATGIDNVSIGEKGEVKPPSSSDALAACFGEKKTDLVFLSKDPTAALTGSAKTDMLSDILECETTAGATNPLCKQLLGWDGSPGTLNEITTAGLDIAPSIPPAPPTDCGGVLKAAETSWNKLSTGALADEMAKPWADLSSLQAVGKSLRIAVGAGGNWLVTVIGAQVMNSLDPAMWPACLGAGTGGAPTCDFSNPMINGFNNAFRGCALEADRKTLPLGQCETSSTGFSGDRVKAELNALLWRVEGATWLLAASSGVVNASTFGVQIPVSDGGTAAALHGTKWAADSDFYADTSRPGFFQMSAGTGIAEADRNRAVNANITAVNTAFRELWTTGEIPNWYADVYTGTHPYLHASAANPEYKSDFTAIRSYFKAKGGDLPPGVDPLAPEPGFDRDAWRKFFRLASNMKCADGDRSGPVEPSIGPAHEVIGLIAALKRNVSTSAEPPVRRARGMTYDGTAFKQNYRVLSVDAKIVESIETGWTNNETTWCHEPALVIAPYTTGDFAHVGASTDAAALPTKLDPNARVVQFVNSGSPCNACGAARQAVQAMALACLTQRTLAIGDVGSVTPTIDQPGDIVKLEAWLLSLEKKAQTQLGRLYLEKVPGRVLDAFRKKGVVAGSKLGTHGDKIVEMTDAVQSIPLAWQAVGLNLAQARDAIHSTRLRLAGIDISGRKELINLQIQQLRVYGNMIQAVANHVSSFSNVTTPMGWFAVGGSGAAATAAITLGVLELDKISDLKDATKDGTSNEVAMALQDLRMAMTPVWSDLEKSLAAVRSSTAKLTTASSQLDRIEKQAQYAAAKGSGAEFYKIDGKPVPMPVNAVLNRQFDALELRYKAALADAKRLAFMARRAIEQRVGIGLAEIDHKVGPMEAPVKWADRICRLQGRDYSRLRLTEGTDAGPAATPQLATELAEAYVGDYIALLENFVEYYNLHYPSHEGDDMSVLSLKNDLLFSRRTCVADGKNLLYYSGRLFETVDPVVAPDATDHRWQYATCAAGLTKCVSAFSGEILMSPNPADPTKSVTAAPPPLAPNGSISWLVDRTPTGAVEGAGTTGAPAGYVVQKADLQSGTYALSWWDQARGPSGEYATITAPYRVAVFAKDWTVLSYLEPTSHVGDTGGAAQWSARRELSVTLKDAQTIYIGFAASPSGGTGSVAIANVQLEAVAIGGSPTGYVATGVTRRVISSICPEVATSALRSAFTRKCNGSVDCYYELNAPLLVDTTVLNDPAFALSSKLAKGNFNYRHIDLALNLVGTGVRDCTASPTSDCFGSGFVEYTLTHDATQAPILDWEGKSRRFDFSLGRIEHGKALTAERFITMPVGSADRSLIEQPGILKGELRGRPLDGNYRLRIFETPALQWDRLDDIQLVLKYRYWSRIDRQAKSP